MATAAGGGLAQNSLSCFSFRRGTQSLAFRGENLGKDPDLIAALQKGFALGKKDARGAQRAASTCGNGFTGFLDWVMTGAPHRSQHFTRHTIWNARSCKILYPIWHVKPRSIQIRHGPPEVQHRIVGERFADMPVRGLAVIMHRRVKLTQWALRSAAAPYWRLYWPLSTGASITYEGEEVQLHRKGLYLIPPHTAFDSHASRPFSKWYVHFTLHGAEKSPVPGVLRLPLTRQMKDLLAATCPRALRRCVPGNHNLPWRLIELVAHVLAQAPSHLWSPGHPNPRLSKAIQLIDQAFASKLTLADLARHAGFSQRSLSKLFVAHTGFAPIRYLTEVRLDCCCRLLRHSPSSIEDIAEKCGFANRFYLSRMMRKYRHTTPAAFRAQVEAS
jgi:AraC-like DNA-binding protein